jgi:4-amino-4-deoxy-L-arabinose transferase-like glycosyltransferase
MALLIIAITGVAVRLVKITQPFTDAWCWRQSDVAMVARNFYQNGFNIFYPQIDWAGASAGYVGMEFPFIPYLAALIYPLAGEQEWVGRSISVIFYLVSLPFFFLFVRRIVSIHAALYAAAFYTITPLSIYAGRSFMSDMASLSLAIISMYPFSKWLDDPGKLKPLAFSGFALCLGILAKPSAVIIGLPLLYLTYEKFRASLFKQRELWLFAFTVLVLPILWHTHAYHISQTYAPYENFGGGLVAIVSLQKYLLMFQEIFFSFRGVTFLLTILMAAGLFIVPSTQGRWFFHWWLLGMMIFVIVAGMGSHKHPWYSLQFVPVAAFFSGRALDYIISKISVLTNSLKFRGAFLASIFSVTGLISWEGIKHYYDDWNIDSRHAGLALHRSTPSDSLILAASYEDPTIFYYSNRKGWFFPSRWFYSDDAIGNLEQCRKAGADYFLINKYELFPDQYPQFIKHLEDNYRYFLKTDDFWIFDLRINETSNAGSADIQSKHHCRIETSSNRPY